MNTKRRGIRSLVWMIILAVAMPPWIFAQAPTGSAKFKQEELDQMLAPVALYPDSLLGQVLIASTYPLEIVQADRWAKANKNLKGDPLTAALEKQNWDPSVKSLVNFSQVLSMMSEKLDWTQKLGDAFLAQQKEVMDTVQKLRIKAKEAGNLKTTQEQKVIVQEKIIIIEPASPQVIYVPAYNPVVVYGPWWYPAYPPYYYYPPGYVATTAAFSFAAGVAVGAAWGYAWSNCNWNHGNINVDINRNININNNINRNNYVQKTGQGGSGTWQHDPDHRKGVSYRDESTRQRFDQTAKKTGTPEGRSDFRGRGQETGGRQSPGTGHQGLEKGKGAGGSESRGLGQGKGSGAFEGVGHGGETRNFSERGSASRQGAASRSGRAGGGGLHR
jgi:hypothetical protein